MINISPKQALFRRGKMVKPLLSYQKQQIILLALCIIFSFSFLTHKTYATSPYFAENDKFNYEEIVQKGHAFFGSTTDNLAKVIAHSFQQYGQPNAVIFGQEASGAIIGGLRYGEGNLSLYNGQQMPVFWQGPSLGFDVGGDGGRTMMLIYNLQTAQDVYRRYGGVDGSAYIVGGVGLTVLGRRNENTLIIPIRTGVGGRFGINVGYLKFRTKPTWNPF